jgi:chloramphenicol-sensitive protein RarD
LLHGRGRVTIRRLATGTVAELTDRITRLATSPTPSSPRTESERGILFGVAAYGLWGVFPIYFSILAPAGTIEILANRIVWSMVFCALAWLVVRDLSWVKPLLAVPRRMVLLTVAAFVLAINWCGYIYAVNQNNVVETSLGYFINPLVLVLMGVLLLHEKLRPLQWAALATGALAVMVIAFDYGRPPWIALTLAFSFAIYGFIKKRVGPVIGALESMTVETLVLAPIALAVLVWIEVGHGGTLFTEGPGHTFALMISGLITAIPLICFSAAARRVSLSTMGFLQFLAPTLQLVVGVWVLGESVPTVRWIGFGIVWIALIMLTADTIRHARRRSAEAVADPSELGLSLD